MNQPRRVPFFLPCLCLTLFVAQMSEGQSVGRLTTVDLTIYNMNLALVREERNIDLSKGLNRAVIPEIPATIDGSSLHFSSLTDPLAVRVLEQNFQYDLLHQATLLQKYVGKEVEFVRLDESTKKELSVQGRLLASGWTDQEDAGQFSVGGQMIAEISGKIEIQPSGRLILPSLPEALILKPQLQWLVTCTHPGLHRTEISYLARQLTWSSSYVALLSKDDNELDLTGWVTVTNRSGVSFHDAGLKLVAGDVNIVQPQRYGSGGAAKLAMDQAEQPQFQQKELFEYKVYALQRRTDVANNETKQIELTSAGNIKARKSFIYDGMAENWRWWSNNNSYRSQGNLGQQINSKVGVFVGFRNDEASGLGIPLPKGKVRVYKKDDDGKEQFVGENEIDHTAKDEEVKLFLGNAFDLVGERIQKEFRTVVSGHVYEETVEIKVRNHKKQTAEVLVYEHPWRWREWEIPRSSGKWERVDQSTLKFPLTIEPDAERAVTYTVRYSW